MKICVSHLQKAKHLELTGDEPWLAGVYASFKSSNKIKLSGSVTIIPEEFGYAKVSGVFDFSPLVSCSRCDKSIPWPLGTSFTVQYKPWQEDELTKEGEDRGVQELDVYYLDPENNIDLEQLMIDLALSDLPHRLVPRADDSESCRICAADLSESAVYKSGNPEISNPFAALKNLNLS